MRESKDGARPELRFYNDALYSPHLVPLLCAITVTPPAVH